MANGWFAFAVVASIVLCVGFVLAGAIIRAAWAQRERESLTDFDLRAVEESAFLLIEQLRSEADRAISEMDNRLSTLSDLLARVDRKLDEPEVRDVILELSAGPVGMEAGRSSDSKPGAAPLDKNRILELASSGMECADIAKATGLDCAEVNLALRIAKFPLRS